MKASVEWLEAELGTAVPRAGLLGVAMKVKGRTGTDLMRSLDSLNTLLIVKFNHFVPKSDSVASYERTLPLFRIYGDLYVTTLVSEIAEFKRVRQHYDAAMKVTELQNVVSRFQQHWTKACGNILADRTRLPNYDCIYFPYMHGAKIATTCRTKMEGKVCYVSTDCYSSHGSFADEYATKNAEERMRAARSTFVQNRRRNLLKYWKNQVGNIVEQWKMIASEFSRVQEAYLM